MPKRAADYEAYLREWDGAVWLLKEDALRLGAGYLPVHDNETTKLPPNEEQAKSNLRTLIGAFNDTRDWLKITKPMTFERDGYRYVEARGFLDWLSQYIDQTQAKEFTFPGELAHAIKRARVMAAASAADEEFASLTRALDGWFDKDWECLPPALRQQIEQKTTILQLLWKTISPEQRLDCARQWDYRHDPATERERREMWNYLSPLFTRLVEAEKELAKWEATDSKGLPSEEELKESKIKKLQEEIDQINASIESPRPLVEVAGHHSTDPQALAPPPVAAPPAATRAPDHQVGQKDDRKGGRPPSQLHLGVEALYLKKLRDGQTALLQPQAGKAFMEELRQAVSGREVCENVVTHIRKLERRSGRYRVYVEDPPEIDGRPPRSNKKPDGYTAGDVSKIMNRLRKKYPLE